MLTAIASFYRFAPLPGARAQRGPLLALMKTRDVKGTILLAPEGINGTISGRRENVAHIIESLEALPGFEHLDIKWSEANAHPFQRSKVKIKKEIIPFGLPAAPHARTARHLDADAWNALLADPQTILLDTRNAYEIEHGTFERAINPRIRHFRQLPAYIKSEMAQYKDRPIATFCTGGVRCEKLTSWMIGQGFTKLYQLNGGILRYMETVSEGESQWQGDCYVFDEREAV